MFGSTSVSAGRGGSGSSNDSPISHEFIWPYGGTRVFLCGSFTKWLANIPMSPMKGKQTGFHVTCTLKPGFYQYMFNVDGEWQHNVQKPCISMSFGAVNIVILAREPTTLSSILNAGSIGGICMQLDHNVTKPMEAFQKMSLYDLHMSRYNLSGFMSLYTAYNLLPNSAKVTALDTNLTVTEAFHILFEQRVSMAPVWNSSEFKFVGVLSAMDIIQIMKEMWSLRFTLTEKQLGTHTIAAWRELKLQKCGTGSNGKTYPWSFVNAGPYDSLQDVALKFLKNKVPTIPIMHSSEDGSVAQLLHLTSLSDILKCICRNFKNYSGSLPVLKLPVGSIPLGTWVPKLGESKKQPLAMLRPNASLSAALSLLIQGELSSIPIVDNNGSLLDIYSRSDITTLAKNEVCAMISRDNISMAQALFWKQKRKPFRQNDMRFPMCLKSHTLHNVIERLANCDVDELVVVESGNSRLVEGIISLVDVFKFFLDYY